MVGRDTSPVGLTQPAASDERAQGGASVVVQESLPEPISLLVERNRQLPNGRFGSSLPKARRNAAAPPPDTRPTTEVESTATIDLRDNAPSLAAHHGPEANPGPFGPPLVPLVGGSNPASAAAGAADPDPKRAPRLRPHARRGLSGAFRILVRLAVISAVIAFVVILLLLETPAVLLGKTVLNQDSTAGAEGSALNDSTAGHSSLIDFDEDGIRSTPVPARTVALTFDDGPSEDWTPRVQEVLDRYGVPGTFFVVGSQVMRHPDIVRRLDRAGHEIGNHSFTHPRLGQIGGWQVQLQTTLTERAVLATTGKQPRVFRPPYSGTTAYLPQQELDAARRASSNRYLTVLTDRVVQDFDAERTVSDLVAQALPAIGSGAVITFHDGGGDRTRTLEALELVIHRLQAAGYRFATVSELATSAGSAHPPASSWDARLAQILVGTTRLVSTWTNVLWYLSVVLIGLTLARIWCLLGLSSRSIRRARLVPRAETITEAVTVIVPAFNEAVGIEATLRSIVHSTHPDVRVIVVDDGSTDDTPNAVERLELSSVRLLRQSNQGKAAALRHGLAEADTEFIVMIDGDTVFEPETIPELILPFNDPAVGAVAGNTKVGNRRSLLAKFQHLEYTASSALERRVLDRLGIATCIPGAVGAFRRAALDSVGGPLSETLAEDADLTMSIVRAGWTVSFAPNARGWTEVPTTMGGFYKQRRRWAYGILQALIKHRAAITERGVNGRLGRAILYQLLFFYGGALIAPAIDLMIIYSLVFDPASRSSSLAIWLGLVAINIVMHGYALHVDGERYRTVAAVPLQLLMYRIVIWLATFRALQSALLGSRERWNKVRRTGGVLTAMPRRTGAAHPAVAESRNKESIHA